jgi:hypothetical protein
MLRASAVVSFQRSVGGSNGRCGVHTRLPFCVVVNWDGLECCEGFASVERLLVHVSQCYLTRPARASLCALEARSRRLGRRNVGGFGELDIDDLSRRQRSDAERQHRTERGVLNMDYACTATKRSIVLSIPQ